MATVLMTRKTKESYQLVFRLLKEHIPGFNMKYVMTDYESGLLAALRAEFPNAHLTGCLFHCDQVLIASPHKLKNTSI